MQEWQTPNSSSSLWDNQPSPLCAELTRPRPTLLHLHLLDIKGKAGVGKLRIESASVTGPLKSPPSVLSGEGLSRLAHRAALVATGVADLTCWERGLGERDREYLSVCVCVCQ